MSEKWNNGMRHFVLMDQAGADGGAAGTGSSLLTTPPTGSGNAAAQGGAGAGANPAGDKSTGNPNPADNSSGGQASDWRTGLPKELQENASLKRYNDIPALAAAYVSAERMLGSDKVPLPGKNATEEDWSNFYKKANGLPEAADKYDLKIEETATLDKAFLGEFKDNALKAGIAPRQAQKLLDWFTAKNKGAEAEMVQQHKAQITQELEGLKSEWGKDYQFNLSRAQAVLSKVADKETLEYLDQSGLGNNTKLIRLLANVGKQFMGEDKVVGEDGLPMESAEDLKKSLGKIMNDTKNPYWDKNHPGHKAAVAEVTDLNNRIYSKK